MAKNKSTHLFSFHCISTKHILFLFIYPVIFKVINYKFSKNLTIKQLDGNLKNIFMNNFGNIIFNGIILIYKKINVENNSSDIFEFHKIKNINLLIYIILDLLIECMKFYFFLFPYFSPFFNFFIPFQYIFLTILSIFSLNLKIYQHHYVSLFIIFFGLFFLNILNLKFKFDFSNIIILKCIGSLFIHFLFSLKDILTHHILYIKDVDVNLLLLFVGISRLILGFILTLINYYKFIGINLFNRILQIFNYNLSIIIIILIYCLTMAIEEVLKMIIFKLYKPWFFKITISMCELVYFFILSNNSLKDGISILKIIILILILFSNLIFCEFIICNFCGLNQNTEKNITERGKDETIGILLINDNDDYD